MTYPPQPGQPGQPGQPDPYGQQQPGSYGADPWGQQPQQPQQPPQPGYPGSGPMPQQQPPGAYPMEQQYGQPGGQPGMGAPGSPPPKKKTGLIVGLSIAAVALIGGALALYFFVFASDDEDEDDNTAQAEQGQQQQPPSDGPGATGQLPPPTQPGQSGPSSIPSMPTTGGNNGGSEADTAAVQTLAEEVIAAVNDRDVSAFEALLCSGVSWNGNFDNIPDGITFVQKGEVVVNGDTATIPAVVDNAPTDEESGFEAGKRDGDWCITGA